MGGSRRFFDQTQPQTLQIATILLYLQAGLAVLFGYAFTSVPGLMLTGGAAGGAFGMANTKKWGYGLALVATVFWLVLLSLPLLFGRRPALAPLMIAGALVALLVHPQSREYQRIWYS